MDNPYFAVGWRNETTPLLSLIDRDFLTRACRRHNPMDFMKKRRVLFTVGEYIGFKFQPIDSLSLFLVCMSPFDRDAGEKIPILTFEKKELSNISNISVLGSLFSQSRDNKNPAEPTSETMRKKPGKNIAANSVPRDPHDIRIEMAGRELTQDVARSIVHERETNKSCKELHEA